MKDQAIAELNKELSCLRVENQELNKLNKQLIDKSDDLQAFLDGEASAKQFYFDFPPHHSRSPTIVPITSTTSDSNGNNHSPSVRRSTVLKPKGLLDSP